MSDRTLKLLRAVIASERASRKPRKPHGRTASISGRSLQPPPTETGVGSSPVFVARGLVPLVPLVTVGAIAAPNEIANPEWVVEYTDPRPEKVTSLGVGGYADDTVDTAFDSPPNP